MVFVVVVVVRLVVAELVLVVAVLQEAVIEEVEDEAPQLAALLLYQFVVLQLDLASNSMKTLACDLTSPLIQHLRQLAEVIQHSYAKQPPTPLLVLGHWR